MKKLIDHESSVINGDGSYSRDFTYIDNVVQANEKALFTPAEQIRKGQKEYYNLELEEYKYFLQKKNGANRFDTGGDNFSEVFNIAYGANTTLLELFHALRENLAKYDAAIAEVQPEFGPPRVGDIPHSQASIIKAKIILRYHPSSNTEEGFARATEWYYSNSSMVSSESEAPRIST